MQRDSAGIGHQTQLGPEEDTTREPPAVRAAKLRFWDAAAVVTVVSGALFLLGWIAWETYCSYFGIDAFMELNVQQVIATTWYTPLVQVALLVLIIAPAFRARDWSDVSIPTRILGWGGGLLLYLTVGLASGYSDLPNPERQARLRPFLYMLFSAGLGAEMMVAFGKREVSLGGLVRTLARRIAIAVLILAALLVVYYRHGLVSARARAQGLTGPRITIETNIGQRPPPDSVLIAHMRRKYFVCPPTAPGSVPQVFVVEDEHAIHVSILPRGHPR